jgi:hypothetical protein
VSTLPLLTRSPSNPSARIASSRVLLLPGQPSAVAWLVSLLRIDAVDRMIARRALAHVGKEQCEVRPTVTDLDSSRAIALVRRVTRILATLMHALPGLPCRSGGPTVLVRAGALPRVLRKLRARLGRDGLSTARTVVPIHVFAHSVPALINFGVFATTACAELRNQFLGHAFMVPGFGWTRSSCALSKG